MLDVTFREDASRVRDRTAARNLTLLRKIALDIVGHDLMQGHGPVWFSNYVCLLLEFGVVPRPAVDAVALQVVQELGPALPGDFGFACRVVLIGRTTRWANLSPRDPVYDVAVRAGCRLFSRCGGEPIPLG